MVLAVESERTRLEGKSMRKHSTSERIYSTQRITCSIGLGLALYLTCTVCLADKNGRSKERASEEATHVDKLRAAEKKLGTDGQLGWTFHRIVENPHGFGFRFPGYLIGIEKSEKEMITHGDPDRRLNYKQFEDWRKRVRSGDVTLRVSVKQICRQEDKLKQRLNDPKISFVSHIVAFEMDPKDKKDYASSQKDEPRPLSRIKSRFLHNAYDYDNKTGRLKTPPKEAYEASWDALDDLKREIIESIQKAADHKSPVTHIIVLCRGWNTPQEKAIWNYNSLGGHLLDAASENNDYFNPIFIGITWPSTWVSAAAVFDYFNKANDADEIGYTWINYLTHEVLGNLVHSDKDIPVVLIGHSFGARILTRAAHSAELLNNYDASKRKPKLVVALQGGFSMNRFLSERKRGQEGAPYDPPGKGAGKTVLTWSRHDKANPVANFVTSANHVGGKPGWKRACKHKDRFEFVTWRSSDKPDLRKTTYDSEKIVMIDASHFVRSPTYKAAGRAHNDIFSKEIGVLLWSLIKRFASNG